MIVRGKGVVIYCVYICRQWTSLCSAGSIGIYVYLYSFYYFFFKTKYVCLSVTYICSVYICMCYLQKMYGQPVLGSPVQEHSLYYTHYAEVHVPWELA